MGATVRGWMIGLSIVGIVYGALVSLMQKDMKKLVAYSSVSHLGFCTLGIFALNQAGLSGSVLQQINHGISTGALFLIVGILYERRHTREIAEYGGISNVMPVYATITMIMFLSSMGLPLLNGFVGEFTILQGAFTANWKWAAWAAPGVVLAAAYLLWLYQRVFFGTVTNPKNEKLHDLTPRETAHLRAAHHLRVLDRPLSQAVLPDPRTAGESDRADRQSERTRERTNYGAAKHGNASSDASARARARRAHSGNAQARSRAAESEQLSDRHPPSPNRIPVDVADGGADHFCARHSADRPDASARVEMAQRGGRLCRSGLCGVVCVANPIRLAARSIGFSNSLLVDRFAIYFWYLFLASAAITILMSVRYLEIEDEHHGEYYALMLLSVVGMMCMAAGIDIVLIFIGLELMAISIYVLVGFLRRDRRSNEAALKYLAAGRVFVGHLRLRPLAALRTLW